MENRRWLHGAIRTLLLVAGLALTGNAGWLALTANLTIGTGLTAVLGLGLVSWAVWFARVGRGLTVTAIAGLFGFAGLAAFLVGFGSQPSATGTEDAVIVLGAAVHGSEPSRTLIGRLDAALAYRQTNPGALIVVSGGQGAQENLPEGVAMADYLIAQGVPSSAVVVEDRATSTEENLAFSRTLLDVRLKPGYRVVLVTDDFHVYRASRIARAAGLETTWVGRATPWYFWAANFLREDLMVVKLWTTGS